MADQEEGIAEIAAIVWARVEWSAGGNVLEPSLSRASPRVPVELWAGSFVMGPRWYAGWQPLLEKGSHVPSLFISDSSAALLSHSHPWILSLPVLPLLPPKR